MSLDLWLSYGKCHMYFSNNSQRILKRWAIKSEIHQASGKISYKWLAFPVMTLDTWLSHGKGSFLTWNMILVFFHSISYHVRSVSQSRKTYAKMMNDEVKDLIRLVLDVKNDTRPLCGIFHSISYHVTRSVSQSRPTHTKMCLLSQRMNQRRPSRQKSRP